MLGWLLANLFLSCLVIVGAAIFWLLGSIAMTIHPWAVGLAGLVALLLAGWIMSLAHAQLERWINRAR